MIRRPPRSTRVRSSAASDVYKRQTQSTLFQQGVFAVALLVLQIPSAQVSQSSNTTHFCAFHYHRSILAEFKRGEVQFNTNCNKPSPSSKHKSTQIPPKIHHLLQQNQSHPREKTHTPKSPPTATIKATTEAGLIKPYDPTAGPKPVSYTHLTLPTILRV